MFKPTLAYLATALGCIAYCSWFTASHLGLPFLGLAFALVKVFDGWRLLLMLELVVNVMLWTMWSPAFGIEAVMPYKPGKMHSIYSICAFQVFAVVCLLNAAMNVHLLLH